MFRFISVFMLTPAILFTSCGDSSIKENEYFGELPSIVKNYHNEIDEKEEEIDEATDMAKAFKLENEKELLEDEMDEAVDEYVNKNPELLNKELPFQALTDTKYTINKLLIDRISTSLDIIFFLTVNEDIKNEYGGIEKNLIIYFKAIDAEGKTIPNTTTVATSFNRVELVTGAEYEAKGRLDFEDLEDFAEIVQITQEEYQKTK